MTELGVSAFEEEVNTQLKFKDTNRNLQPITPLIYSSYIYKGISLNNFLEHLEKICDFRAKNKLHSDVVYMVSRNRNLQIGVIFMEMRDGYVPVSTLSERYDQSYHFLAMTGEILNRLHFQCKVTHGDLHQSNLLINPNVKDIYNPNKGNLLIIDWGRAKYYPNGVPGTQETPIPYKETLIEFRAAGEGPGPKDWWSYRWLSEKKFYRPGPGGPGGPFGIDWKKNNSVLQKLCLELRKARSKNYNTMPEKTVKYFFQPPDILRWGEKYHSQRLGKGTKPPNPPKAPRDDALVVKCYG